MITRKMNHRVTFFREVGGQNEDGEVISPSRKNLYTCWAEVAKTSLKRPFDSSDHVEFNGFEYDIVSVDVDESSFDMDKIGIKRRT